MEHQNFYSESISKKKIVHLSKTSKRLRCRCFQWIALDSVETPVLNIAHNSCNITRPFPFRLLPQTHNMSEMPFYGFRHFPVYQTIGRFNSGFCYEKYRIDNVCKNGSQLYSLVKSYGRLVWATCRLEEDVSRSATSFRRDSNIH